MPLIEDLIPHRYFALWVKNTEEWEIALVDYYGSTITLKNQKQSDWIDESLSDVLGTLFNNFAPNYKIIFWNEQDMLSSLLLSELEKHILNLKLYFEKEGEAKQFDKMAVPILGLERAGGLTTVIENPILLI